MRRFFLFLLFGFVLFACRQRPTQATSSNDPGLSQDHFDYLFQCMQGEFSSEEQSKNDSDYFHIRLRMIPVWQKEANVFYLYVEQSMATNTDKPYRQRFYKVVKNDDNHYTSHIYMVSNPARFTGKDRNDPIFNRITADSLQLKDGCEVYLTYNPATKTFEGSTRDKTCPSDRSGAAYATAKVVLSESEMRSWDQGWNAEGKQVWGATKGGYIFKKR